MRDQGLSEAIRAAGSVSELARQIVISQPSVSNWIRIPAERVISVEAATGVDRTILRPDLYGGKTMAGEAEKIEEVDEVDNARALEYALIASLLTRAPDAQLLSNLAGLRGDASPLGMASLPSRAWKRSSDVPNTPNASLVSEPMSHSRFIADCWSISRPYSPVYAMSMRLLRAGSSPDSPSR